MDPARRPAHRPPRVARMALPLDVDALAGNRDTRIIVCCGSGGVGKTTSAAAIGLRAAERGRSVAVLTIDPARRLAQSLGLTELGNTPRAVPGIDADAGGCLDAMMLDMKRTFDEVVEAHSSPQKAEQILANPFYQALSSSFAGTQEYMAMEKLGQLQAQRRDDGSPRWDLIVVDTPPSRSALDFLDAPARLGSFLDGTFVRLLLTPAKAGGRAYLKVVSASVSIASRALAKVLGQQLLGDLQLLVSAMDTMFGGFRERADQTYALLKAPGTAFLVVASPQRDALREAGFFVERLRADDMPLAGVVINRLQPPIAPAVTVNAAQRGAATLAEDGREDTAGLLRLQAYLGETADRHAQVARRFAERNPGVPLATVPAFAQDVHDLDGLRRIGADLQPGGSDLAG